MIRYEVPHGWIVYDGREIVDELARARAAMLSLTTVPYQKGWVEKLQQIQLKREVAGTSRIEGADFTDRELDAAMKESPQKLITRSQKQAQAAVKTYRWIATLPDDMPIDAELILNVHRKIVSGGDDCPPGQTRKQDENVTFGTPRHRGAEGGIECEQAFYEFTKAIQHEYRGHDLVIQGLAAHYHLAAMHPFLDGNGRTARALEALMLQRAGLRDTCFIAMSNYYYDEKSGYLAALSETRQRNHDLTPFLKFGLAGIEAQSRRLLSEIQAELCKALFRNLMWSLFHRLRSPKKRVIVQRQIEILKLLLDVESMEFQEIIEKTSALYSALATPRRTLIRDLNYLIDMQAVGVEKLSDNRYKLWADLQWPTKLSESDLYDRLMKLPKGKTYSFLQ